MSQTQDINSYDYDQLLLVVQSLIVLAIIISYYVFLIDSLVYLPYPELRNMQISEQGW